MGNLYKRYYLKRYSSLFFTFVTALLLSFSAKANTYTVTNTNNSGAGSLRQAVDNANSNAGADVIDFNIAGSGPYVIALTASMDSITGPVTIDGSTQTGYTGAPIIQIDGTSAGSVGIAIPLNLGCTNSIIKGLVIKNFQEFGIYIEASGCTVKNCYIGTDLSGTLSSPNGVSIYSIENNGTIGGATAADRNVLSGNSFYGIELIGNSHDFLVENNYIGVDKTGASALSNGGDGIFSSCPNSSFINNVVSGATGGEGINLSLGSDNTMVQGNYVGTNAAGTSAIGNNNTAVYIHGAKNCLVGGTTAAERNILSGNKNFGGIEMASGSGNTIEGNYIGLNASGNAAIGNNVSGITHDGATSSIIINNVISGNTGASGYGINITAGSATIKNNYIGLDATGASAIPNAQYGIRIATTTVNTIGGTSASDRNYIAGNAKGGILQTAGTGHTIENNYIGLNVSGTAVANGDGVDITGANCTFGNAVSGGTNYICGNTAQGISITGSGNKVINCYVGINPAGTTAIANGSNGINITGATATIGGTSANQGNVISGNTGNGIALSGNSATIQGNIIGLNAAGTSAVANGSDGITITAGTNSLIGGGASAACRNFIAGQSGVHNGISVSGAATPKIQNNYIGTEITGSTAIANGIGISASGTGALIIGSDLDGSNDAAEGNIIAGNTTNGILLAGSNAKVNGNIIGLNASGSALANGTGILITGINNTVGNSTATTGAANTISDNTNRGIYIQNAAATGNVVQGNYIGTNTGGTSALANGSDGIIIDGAKNNTIGGNAATNRNIISGNTANGIFITNSATGNTVANNYIGTDVNGSTAIKNNIYGITLNSNGNTIGKGNLISGNNNGGININSANSNIVNGNYLGITATGTSALNNNNNADITIGGTSISNIIGGTTAADRNIISGSSPSPGIIMNASGNTVEGNYIGTNAAGTGSIPNTIGINVTAGPNTIGGVNSGNVIAGNSSDGIKLNTSINSNTIIGNYLGVDTSGSTVLANSGSNINLVSSSSNTIGSTTAGGANILSGNSGGTAGIEFGTGSNSNILTGNYIGLNAAGTSALPNSTHPGVLIDGATGTQVISNVISGNNSDGIKLTLNSATIQGNYIGLNAAGTGAVANTNFGINLVSTSSGSAIGGTTSGQGNVISGNTSVGIFVGSTGHTIRGNIIGLDAAGTSAIANFSGIEDNKGGITIGGGTAAARNIISGNTHFGIQITSSAGSADLIQNNYVGTDITGASAIGNGSNGIDMNSADHSVLNNVLSGNSSNGLVLQSGSNSVIVKGNYAGTNAAGTSALANGAYGIAVGTTANSNTIGGTSAGDGNLISGNTTGGLLLTAASNTTIEGNIIGADINGANAIANGVGININSSSNTIIGGTTAGSANLISGNTGHGISTNSTVIIKGNFIGTDTTGSLALANGGDGINASSSGNTIGGNAPAARNIIAGNSNNGITLTSGSNTIQGNYIGLDSTGTAILANGGNGISISSASNVIGGISASDANVISGNSGDGIKLTGGSNTIRNNYIGTNADGTSAVGNTLNGIELGSSLNTVTDNLISGNNSNGVLISAGSNSITSDTITNNGGKGVAVTSGTGNLISQNSIAGNTSIGIDLANNGVTLNDAGDGDTGPNNLQNFPVITNIFSSGGNTTISGSLNSTPSSTFIIEFFGNTITDPSGYGQGKTFIGSTSVSTNGSGNATFNSTFAGTFSIISATATDASNNTSEFCQIPVPKMQVQTVSNVIIPNNSTPAYNDSTSVGDSIVRTYWIKNIGSGNLAINYSSGVTGFGTGIFPINIGGGDSASFTVTLLATSTGIFSGNIALMTNDTGATTYKLAVKGWVGCWNALYVDPAGSDTVTGSSSTNAKKTVQAAVNALCDGGIIYLKPGSTFNETVNSKGKSFDFAFTSSSPSATTIANLTINGSGKTVTLDAPLTITGTITFTNGILKTSSGNPLILSGNGANCAGGNATSYIDGPVKFSISGTQTRTTTLTLGKGSYYRPISLFTDITDVASAGNTFQAEMFNTDPHSLGLALPTGTNLAYVRYFQVDHTTSNGTINSAQITLPFTNDGTNDSISDLSNVKIVKGNGSGAWVSLGGSASGSLSGSFYNGSVSSNSFTTFSPFALATGCGSNPQPVVGFSYSNSCVNSSVTFTNSTTISSGSVDSFIWDFGDGSSQVAQNSGPYPPNPSINHTYTSAGIYVVNLEATTNLSCQVLLTKYITINPLPAASIGSGPTVCSGSTATIPVTISNVASTDGWKLIYTEGATSKNITGTGPGNFSITTASLASNTTVTLTTVQNTTTTCSQSLSGSATVTVNATTVAGSTAGSATVCSGSNSGSVTLSGNTGSIIKWQYSTDGGTTWYDISNTSSTQSYTNLGATTQYRALVQSGVCASAASSATMVTVNPLPTASISGSTSICAGNTANLTVAVANTGGASWSVSYLEGSGNKTLTGTGNGNFTLTTSTLSSTTGYNLQSISLTSGSPACSNSSLSGVTSATVTVNPLPSATIGSGPTICSGSTATIPVTISNVASTDGWKLVYTEGATSKNITGTGPGNFSITTASLSSNTTVALTSVQNTTTTCSQSLSGSATVTVNATTVAGSTAGSATVCSGSNSGAVTLSGNTGSIVKWQYSTDGGTTWYDISNTSSTQPYTNLGATTQYRALVQSGVCASAASSATTVTVNPLPTAAISGSTSICAGNTANLTVAVANTGGASWSVSYLEGSGNKTLTGTGNGNFTLTTSTLSSTTDYNLQSISLTSGSPACSNSSLSGVTTATVTINPLPAASIGSGPTVCSGSTATIPVTISNVASTDGWKLIYTEGATSKNITGTGPGSFSITTASLSSNTTVTLTSVQNTTTTCSQSLSGSVTVTVNATTVAGSTSGSATVCSGSNSGSVTLSGNTGSIIKWQYSTDGGATWYDISNTSSTQSYTNLGASTLYRAVVQSGVCASAASSATMVTVNPLPTASISGSTSICAGNTANLTVAVANTGGASWSVSYLEGSGNKTLTGTGNGNFTLTTSTLSSTTSYDLESISLTSGSPACSNSSLSGVTSATVTVNPLPSATIGSGPTICSGSTATIPVTISNVASTDGWKLIYTEGATSKNITGTGPGNFSITTASLSSNTTVALTSVQNTTTTCSQSLSGSATVTVNATTVAGSTAGSATVCSGSNSGSVTLSGNTGSIVKWQYSTDGGTTWYDISNTSSTQPYTNLGATTQYRALVQSGVCASAASSATMVTVNPLPTASISGSTSICAGNTANLTVAVANTGGASWSVSYLEGSTSKTLTGTGNGNFTLTTSTLSSTTGYNLQSISLTSGSPACSNSSLSGVTTATVTINPLPAASIGSGPTICSGSTATIPVTISNVASTDGWKLVYTEGATSKNITGTGPGSFSITTASLASNTTVTLTSVQNTTTTCSQSLSGSVTVTVNATTVAGSTAGSATVCSGSNSGSVTLSGNTGSIVKWQYSTDGGTTWYDISNTSSTQSYTNLSASTLYRAVVQSGVCASAASSATMVTVNPLPTASISGSTSICAGNTANLTVAVANTGGASWSVSYLEGSSNKTLTGTGNGNFTLTTSTLSSTTDYNLQSISLTSGSPACSNSSLSGVTTATVTVNPLPAASIGSGPTVCSGSTATIPVTISNVASTDGWKLVYTEGATSKNITGTGPGNFSITTASLASNTTVTLTTVQNTTTTCSQSLSGSATITVNPTTVGGSISGTTTACGTVNSGTLSLSSNVGNVARWESSVDGGTTWSNITNSSTSQSYGNLSVTTMYRALIQSGVCSSAYSGNATITVNPQPSASMSGSQTICSGTTPIINVTVTNIPSGQNWSLSYTEGATNKTLTGSGSGAFVLNASSLTNSTASQVTIPYSLSTITNTSLSCTSPALSSTATVKVDPTTAGGTLATTASSVCYGTNSGTIKLNNQVGAILRWEYSTDAGTNWFYISNTSNTLSFANLTTATAYRVLVQSGTCSAAYSSSQIITVNPLPVASMAGSTSVCTNNSSVITFTVINVGASDNWTINYTLNAVAKSYTGTGIGSFNYTTPVMNYPPGNVVYSLTGINNTTMGCSNSANGTATIQVNPKPIVNYSFKNVCFGFAMDFVNKSTIPVGNINSYVWDFGDGNTSTDINPEYTYSVAGSFNVKLVVYSEFGCKDSITQSVTVFPKPVASFTYKNTCESDSAVFASTSTVSSGSIKTTSWDLGDTTSALTSPKHKYNYTGNFAINMSVLSDKGCVDATAQNITVYPMPKANFTAEPVCQYDSMRFINQSDIGYGSLTYKWTFEPGMTSTLQTPEFKFSSAGNFLVKLIAISNFGCKDSLTQNVVINPKPAAGFSTKDVCIGQESIFDNTSTVSPGSVDNISWDFGDSNYSVGSIVAHIYLHPGKYNVLLIAGTNQECVDTITKIVSVHALPPAKITVPGGLLNLCYGGSVALSAPSGLKYLWNTGAATQSITASKSGNYEVLVNDSVGCSNKDSVSVIVYPNSVANAGRDTTISLGFSATLHGSGGVNYSWAPPGSLDNPDAQDPVATPQETTVYTLTMSDIHGCVSVDSVTVNVINDYKVITYNTITPNGDGVNDNWVIDNINTYKGATITIYNRYGQVLFVSDNYQNDWHGTFNGQNLPQGTYYYTITFKDNDKVYKGAINILRNE